MILNSKCGCGPRLSLISNYLLQPPVLYVLAWFYSKCGCGPRPVCRLLLIWDEISRQVLIGIRDFLALDMATPSKHMTSGLIWLCLPMSWMSRELCPKLCAIEPGVKWNGRKKETNAPVMIKISINRHKSYWWFVTWIWCDENGTLPLWSSSQ